MKRILILAIALICCFVLSSCDVSAIVGALSGGGSAGGGVNMGGVDMGDFGDLGGNQEDETPGGGGMGDLPDNTGPDTNGSSKDEYYELVSVDEWIEILGSTVNYTVTITNHKADYVGGYEYLGERTIKTSDSAIYHRKDFRLPVSLEYDREETYIITEGEDVYRIDVDGEEYFVTPYEGEFAPIPISSHFDDKDLRDVYSQLHSNGSIGYYGEYRPDEDTTYFVKVAIKDGAVVSFALDINAKDFLRSYTFTDIGTTVIDMSRDIIGSVEDSVVTEEQFIEALDSNNFTAVIDDYDYFTSLNGSYAVRNYTIQCTENRIADSDSASGSYYDFAKIEREGVEVERWIYVYNSSACAGYVGVVIDPIMDDVRGLLFNYHGTADMYFDADSITFSDFTFNPQNNMYEYNDGKTFVGLKFSAGKLVSAVYKRELSKLYIDFSDFGTTVVEIPEYTLEWNLRMTVTMEEFVANMMRTNYHMYIIGYNKDDEVILEHSADATERSLTLNDVTYLLIDGAVYELVYDEALGKLVTVPSTEYALPSHYGEQLLVLDPGVSYEEIYCGMVEKQYGDIAGYEYHFELEGATDAYYIFFFQNGVLNAMSIFVEGEERSDRYYLYSYSYGDVTDDMYAEYFCTDSDGE